MKYDFRCEECGEVETLELALDEFEAKKADGTPCVSCEGGTAQFKFDTSGICFSFKGDAWSDKNYKEKEYRKNRSRYMARRQAKNNKRPTLKPNYKGQEAASWKEAQDAARADGKVHESYEPLISAERAGK